MTIDDRLIAYWLLCAAGVGGWQLCKRVHERRRIRQEERVRVQEEEQRYREWESVDLADRKQIEEQFDASLVSSVEACNRAAAEGAIVALYRWRGLAPPDFIWFDSPARASMASAFFYLAPAVLNNDPTALDYFRLSDFDPLVGNESYRSRRILFQGEWRSATNSDFNETCQRWSFLLNLCRRCSNIRTVILRSAQGSVHERSEHWRQNWEELAKIVAPYAKRLGLNPAVEIIEMINNPGCCGRGTHQYGRYFPLLAGRECMRFGLHELDHFAWQTERRLRGRTVPESLDLMVNAAIHCGWWFPFKDVCLMSERPVQLSFDQNGLLHDTEAMSIRFADDSGAYCLRGIPVRQNIAQGRFTAADVNTEFNAEVRRVMIDRLGIDTYVRDGGFEVVSSDSAGTLYRSEHRIDGEKMCLVKVTNSTSTPDGGKNVYFLRVPPNMRSAREAVAWTFQMRAREYRPTIET